MQSAQKINLTPTQGDVARFASPQDRGYLMLFVPVFVSICDGAYSGEYHANEWFYIQRY